MGQPHYINLENYEQGPSDGFVRMLTSYNPQHNPTYIDEGNAEMFVVEQKDAEGHVDQLHLTPNQAFEMREKLDKWLEKHFPARPKMITVKHSGMVAKAASILPLVLMAACKIP